MENTWELYSSMQGWQAVSRRLDSKLATALKRLDRDLSKHISASFAALKAFKTVSELMSKPEVSDFGASDSEPREMLAIKINQHLKTQHKIGRTLDGWGDAI